MLLFYTPSFRIQKATKREIYKMFSKVQHTVKQKVRAAGVGLHTGKVVSMEITPAPADAGICFIRKDLGPDCIIPAKTKYVVDGRFASTIGVGEATVSTVEHLMAALFGAGVDNAFIVIDGPEVPAMDGSAAPFLGILHRAGLVSQEARRKYLKIVEPFTIQQGDKVLSIEPSDSLHVSFKIDFDHPLISTQRFNKKITRKSFSKGIAKARTFGFLNEVELLKKNGFALGGSLDNAVVLGDDAILNEGGLRFSDEFVRHKVLDLLGDLYLAGMPILGKITAEKTGHSIHHKFVQELLARPYAWRIVDLVEDRRVVPWVSPVDDLPGHQVLPA